MIAREAVSSLSLIDFKKNNRQQIPHLKMWAAPRFEKIRHGEQPISSDMGYFIISIRRLFFKINKEIERFLPREQSKKISVKNHIS